MLKKKLESDEQSKIIKYLEAKGAYARKIILTPRNGTPDIFCCYKGLFIAFEVKRGKREKANTPELQKYNAKQIEKSGGMAFLVMTLDEVKEIFTNNIDDFTNKQNYDKNSSSIRS